MPEMIDTIIVGGGQAGLATSYCLRRQGREHIVLERSTRVGSAWHQRWDSFTLITPNWSIRLPGAEYQGDHPDDFMPKSEIIDYLEKYACEYEMPLVFDSQVSAVEPCEGGFRVRTSRGEMTALNVVIATGMYQTPKVPPLSAAVDPGILQIHSHDYRSPESLPPGGVLVVGSAQSGCQIAEELYQSGRQVYLSVSKAGRFPRRYRGKDILRWNVEIGSDDRTVDSLPSPASKFEASSHGTGKNGGHTINLHQFARDGVVLLGRIQSAARSRIRLWPDLKENLAFADQVEAELVKEIDEYIMKNGISAPEERLPSLQDGYASEETRELDLRSAGITSIVWATGFRFDFSLVKLPVFDRDGFPIQRRGVTPHPGLYFIGLPYLYTTRSGTLGMVGRDAAHLVEQMKMRAPQYAYAQQKFH